MGEQLTKNHVKTHLPGDFILGVFFVEQPNLAMVLMCPYQLKNGVRTPISRVISTELPIYKAIYRVYSSIYNR